ncbi:hypothetical protein [Phyllobacterium sp. OV277]|jgi:hypothetical protein|uniref:hypothetical protein n=1 Tax=Phyllobacterium sp. OV277 TaxID=1882772 RepID=UPI000881B1CE|nr:hypothetical protein [Phyllobacterium sp. OV277]SDO79867.1 hypothetical protein SAMN05443582_1021099 [Phyllobacterium sp. OV277]
MWRLLKKLFSGPEPSTVTTDSEVIRFDQTGFTRSSQLIRDMGWREHWNWDEIDGFGFSFKQAMFPDPWFGDYMESEWFIIVENENGPEHIYFDADWLNIDNLPPALLQNMPDLDRDELRKGLHNAAGGFHYYAGEGQWVGWQRPKPAKRANAAKKPAAKPRTAPVKRPRSPKKPGA